MTQTNLEYDVKATCSDLVIEGIREVRALSSVGRINDARTYLNDLTIMLESEGIPESHPMYDGIARERALLADKR